jgi:Ca2+-binding RTX toxin-like protein
MKGTKSSDTMYGLGGDDELDGDDGRDILHGGTGNDELKGGDDNDMLVGVDINFEFGTGEIDKMKGEKGADMFVLGDASRAYYLGKGNADYALIEDFDKKEGDKVQLHGEASDYSLGLDIKGLDKGMAIFLGNDLVGIVKDVKSLELTDTNVLTFVAS